MKTKKQTNGNAAASKAVKTAIERTAKAYEEHLGIDQINVQVNPFSGKAKITPIKVDCEDGMYQPRWSS